MTKYFLCLKCVMDAMIVLETELLEHLGFKLQYYKGDYSDILEKYNVKELEHEHESALETDYGLVFFLKNFPNHMSPLWNMKYKDGDNAYKVDVILHGIETIGTSQRSTDIIKHIFHF